MKAWKKGAIITGLLCLVLVSIGCIGEEPQEKPAPLDVIKDKIKHGEPIYAEEYLVDAVVINSNIVIDSHVVCAIQGSDIKVTAEYAGPNEIIVTEQQGGSYETVSISECHRVEETIGPLPSGDYTIKVIQKRWAGGVNKLTGEFTEPGWRNETKLEKTVSIS